MTGISSAMSRERATPDEEDVEGDCRGREGGTVEDFFHDLTSPKYLLQFRIITL